MCLLVMAYQVDPHYPLIVAANRDEFHERPTAPLHQWQDAPHIIAGRDLQGGGTWMGVTTQGIFAALTNHRDMRRAMVPGRPSRGSLVRKALEGQDLGDTSMYEGCNLIHGHWRDLWYHDNVRPTSERLPPGIHGLSNAFLNTPWPKVRSAVGRIRQLVEHDERSPGPYFDLLALEELAPDHELPSTGLEQEWERKLSAIRIKADGYGTRSSTVLMVERDGTARIWERTFTGLGKVNEMKEIIHFEKGI